MNEDTSSTFNFKCPQCGEQVFKFDAKPTAVDEAGGGSCVRCSHVLTNDEIERQALEIATAKMQGVLSAALGDAFKLP